MDFHLCQLKLHCRLCGSLLVHKKGRKQLKASHPRVYLCSAFASELHSCFGLDAANDEAQIHPHSFCKRCYDAMQRKLKAVSQHRHFNSRMELYKWEAHASDDECKVRSNAGCSSNVNLHNLYSNPRFVTILGLNIMVEDHTRLKRP